MLFDRTGWLKTADATVGAVLCRVLGRLVYLSSDARPAPDPAAGDVRRILVIRPGGMGDMLVLLPVLRNLAHSFPEATLTLACEKRNLPVLQLPGVCGEAGLLARVHPVAFDAAPLRFLRMLRTETFDLAVDTEQFHHFSAVFAQLSGAPARIGFNINPRRNSLYTHLVSYAPDGPEAEQFARLLAPLGVREQSSALDGFLARAGGPLPAKLEDQVHAYAGDGKLVAVHAGGRTACKRWTTEGFAGLVRDLSAQHGLRCVLAGDIADRAAGRELVAALAATGDTALCLAGRTTLSDTASLLRKCALYVGTDSGLAHLAVALGVPTVILFGPSDHRKWGIRAPGREVVSRDLACSPCCLFGYHKLCRSVDCMRGIEPQTVLRACRAVLEAPSPIPRPAADGRAPGRSDSASA